jgi:hypothetical protein
MLFTNGVTTIVIGKLIVNVVKNIPNQIQKIRNNSYIYYCNC